MKCLIDSNLPPMLVDWLWHAGHEALHVDDALLPSASDEEIWRLACDSGAIIIITKDSDFRDRASREASVPVICLRSGNLKLVVFLAWFAKRWPAAQELAESGERVVEMR